MKGLRSVGFLKLVAASAFLVSATMAFGSPITIKFHGRTSDPDSSGAVIVNPNTIGDLPGALLGSYIGPTTGPAGTGDPNILLGPIVPVSPPISAPNIAPITDPTGIGDPVSPSTIAPSVAPTTNPSGTGGPNVPQGVVSPNTPVSAPDSGSSVEILSVGLVALLLFHWNTARAAIRAKI